MVKVCVFQTDNRPSLQYLLDTKRTNKRFCDILDYHYLFLELDNHKYGNIHPATKKIYVVNNILQNTNCDILVFLDSDAWIQNGYWLNDLINNLINNPEKHGCFSRDPYLKIATFINSGSFIIKNNDYIKKMYENLINDLETNLEHANNWPYDQYYISNFVFKNKENFMIFVPEILNTPIGKVLRHNWYKNDKMWHDVNTVYEDINKDPCFGKSYFNEKEYYDEKDFPNTIEEDLSSYN